MKTLLITLIFTISFINISFSQSLVGIEKQNVYNAKDGRTAYWYD